MSRVVQVSVASRELTYFISTILNKARELEFCCWLGNRYCPPVDTYLPPLLGLLTPISSKQVQIKKPIMQS